MAYWADRTAWNRAASIIAKVHNVNLGEGSEPISPKDVSPYTAEPSQTASIRITRDNIGILKTLAGRKR